MVTKLFILTQVRYLDLLYGSTLIFNTVRVGWPNAEIEVWDNGSIYEALPSLAEFARKIGAEFVSLTKPVSHHAFLAQMLESSQADPIVFCDPDLVFWGNFERYSFTGLFAGRLLPTFFEAQTGAITHMRLHTSHLIIPNVSLLKESIASLPALWRKYGAAAPSVGFKDQRLHHWDTGALLYEYFRDRCEPFQEAHLNTYDHLFCGTHLDLVQEIVDPVGLALLHRTHALAQMDKAKLRGIWREQEAYFQTRAVR